MSILLVYKHFIILFLYYSEKKPCQSDQDVQVKNKKLRKKIFILFKCEFCITGWKEFGNNRDFEIKCAQMINIRKIFHRQLSERKIQQQNQQQQANGDLWKKITMAFPSGKILGVYLELKANYCHMTTRILRTFKDRLSTKIGSIV